MPDLESKQFMISGEAAPGDWSLAMQVLGRLGITATPTSSDAIAPDVAQTGSPESIEPGTIPYVLSEIDSRDQYVSNEHLAEFWPEYRDMLRDQGIKAKKSDISWGLDGLITPTRKGMPYRQSEAQTSAFAAELGLTIVRPRSRARFSDEYVGRLGRGVSRQDAGDGVIQVGSFIDSVRALAELPSPELPMRVGSRELRVFTAFADKLEAQVKAKEVGETVETIDRSRQEAMDGKPTSLEIIDSVIEQVRSIPDPLGRIVVMDQLSKEMMPAIYEHMMADAAEFREAGGTWRQIGEELGVTPQSAQGRFTSAIREKNAERARQRRGAGADPERTGLGLQSGSDVS